MLKDILGFIGMGIMGRPMTHNLLKHGYNVAIYGRKPELLKGLLAEGANLKTSIAEVAKNSRVIITMLPNSPDSENVILGCDGIVEHARPGSIVIDMSSIAPSTTKKIAGKALEYGIEMLDAPVSGGEPSAINGTLSIMVGGKEEIFNRCLPILESMGKSIIRTGDIGSGNMVKLANQIIVAANIEAVGEAFSLTQKAGIDPNIVFQAIRGGLAGSNVLEAKAPMIISREFTPGFRIRLHQKDINNALMTANELGVPVPVASLIQQILGAIINQGKGDLDHSAIVTFLEELAGTTIGKERE